MKKWAALLGIIGLLIAGDRLHHLMTDGFIDERVKTHLPFDPAFDLNQTLPKDALTQTYHYIGCGAQNFAFASEDGRYVIKFFKHHRYRYSKLIAPLVPDRVKRKAESRRVTYQSCLYALNSLNENSGIEYLHFNHTSHIGTKLKVFDKLGVPHTFDLDRVHFILQKKGTMTDEKLLALKKSGDHEKAKELLIDLLNFNVERHQKGFSDKDPHLIKNLGFDGDRPMLIDIGGLVRDPKKGDDYFFGHEMHKIEQKALPWISQNYPELETFFKASVNYIQKKREQIKRNS
ncbi:MAG: hypothetical protein SP1CHLAM54_01270 [Chlamydiia bacterium]|nr:hypothetical protein [Chlamydiia bacterium]MCH9615048.1 hypothetical protein [Chlamydiia bacterium]MCH9629901.1 hypothetical protein [Chlamydiia bacterium]